MCNSCLRIVVLHYLNILSFILSVSESYQLNIKVTHGWRTENHLFYDEFNLTAFFVDHVAEMSWYTDERIYCETLHML